MENRLFRLDLAIMAAVSIAIALWCQDLLLMTVLIPILLGLRMVGWYRLTRESQPHSMRTELLFFSICILLGAFNDWNSVVNKQIYDYTVPHYFPNFSSIPIWMLLFWGMILRFMVSLFQIPSMQPATKSDNRLFTPAPLEIPAWARVTLILTTVLVTRQFIYRYYLDPVLSWLPFAIALAVFPVIFPPSKADGRLVALALVFGPLIEMLYIQVGGLHRYHHGALMGVPVWIMLWWMLIIPIWRDLSGRIVPALEEMTKP